MWIRIRLTALTTLSKNTLLVRELLVSALLTGAVLIATLSVGASPAGARAAGARAAGHPAADDDQALPGPGATVVTSQAGFGWPLLPAPSVSRRFQPPEHPYGPGHRGVDLVGRPSQPVLAAGDGVVVFAGSLADRGVVSIAHAGGLRTTYEPVLGAVRPGAVVRRGQPIGTLARGHPGCPAAACLHWGLLRERRYRDPIQLVAPTAVRLLPWPQG
jgi:murein DD-endopeptidase MepM/ murein hydrolase activator NlpD